MPKKYDHRYKEQLKIYIPHDVRHQLNAIYDSYEYEEVTYSAIIEELITAKYKQMQSGSQQ